MLIHTNGWKIIRDGTDYYAVPPPSIDPEQKPIPLRKKSPLARQRQRELEERQRQRELEAARGRAETPP